MLFNRSLAGLTVKVVVPVPVTKPLVISIVSTTLSSDVLCMTILPLLTATASSNTKTMLLSIATSVESSVGVDELSVGAVVSLVSAKIALKVVFAVIVKVIVSLVSVDAPSHLINFCPLCGTALISIGISLYHKPLKLFC